jgi:hypothetical protein
LRRSLSGRSSTLGSLVSIRPQPYKFAMAKSKKLTPRKRLEALFPFLHSLGTAAEPEPYPRSERLARQIERVLRRPLRKAFKEAKLNFESEEDRGQLLVWLAWAVYGGKSPGAPRKWRPKKLRRLLDDVRTLQNMNPGLSETACCNRLSKGKDAGGRYEEFKNDTLRRVLQNAKRLDRKAKVLVTPPNRVVTPGSIGSAGEKPSC